MEADRSLAVKERAALALGLLDIERTLTDLSSRSTSILVITNPDGYKQVNAARLTLKNQRVDIEKKAKAARDSANAFARAVSSEEKRLVGIIAPEEERLHKLQKAYDDVIEEQRQAKIRAETQRVADIQTHIEAIKSWPQLAIGKPVLLVQQILQSADDYVVTEDAFQEFTELATATLQASRESLRAILDERRTIEADQERIRLEREELAKQRREQLKREAEERIRRQEEDEAKRRALDLEQQRLAAERAKLEHDRDELLRAQQQQQQISDDGDALIADRLDPPALIEIPVEIPAANTEDTVGNNDLAAARSADDMPSEREMIAILAAHYEASEAVVIDWIIAIAKRVLASRRAVS